MMTEGKRMSKARILAVAVAVAVALSMFAVPALDESSAEDGEEGIAVASSGEVDGITYDNIFEGGTLTEDYDGTTVIGLLSYATGILTSSLIVPEGIEVTIVLYPGSHLTLAEGVAIIVYGTLKISGSGTIWNNYTTTGYTIGTNYGAVYVADGGTLNVTGVIFNDIYASNPNYDETNYSKQSSAIYADAGSTVTLYRTAFKNCYSEYGTAVYVYATSGTVASISNCTFSYNAGGVSGTAFATSISGGSVSVDGCTFSYNEDFCAFYAYVNSSGSLSIADTAFNYNTSEVSNISGGALYLTISDSSTVEIDGCTFTGNDSAYNAGALYASVTGSSLLEVTGCTFSGNTSDGDGGAMHLYEISGSTVLFDSCTFSSNYSYGEGGVAAIYGTSGNYYICFSGCTFSGNTCEEYGSVLYVSSYNENYGTIVVNLSSCTFTNNACTQTTSYEVYLDTSTVTLYTGEYVLSYDANGGEGAPDSIGGANAFEYGAYAAAGTIVSDANCFLVSDDEPTYTYRDFLGWSTDADADSGDYEAWDQIVVSADTTLYAIWEISDASAANIEFSGLDDGEVSIMVTETASISVDVSGIDDVTYTLAWEVADSSIASIVVSSDGGSLTVTGVAVGETTLTLTLTIVETGSSVSVEIPVSVTPVQVSSIVISGSTTITVGDSTTLRAVSYPTTAEVRTVTWSIVSEDGGTVAYTITEKSNGSWITLTGQIAGTLTVTATADDDSGVTASVTLIVQALTADYTVTISGVSTLAVGDTQTYTATVLPTSAEDRSVTWTITVGSDLVEYTVTETDYGGAISLTGLEDGQVTLLAVYYDNGEVVAQASYNVAVVSYAYSDSVADVAGSLLDSLSDFLGDNSDAASIAIICVIILALLVLLESKWLAFLVGIPAAVVLSALGLLEGDVAAIICVIAAAGVAITASGVFTGGKAK